MIKPIVFYGLDGRPWVENMATPLPDECSSPGPDMTPRRFVQFEVTHGQRRWFAFQEVTL